MSLHLLLLQQTLDFCPAVLAVDGYSMLQEWPAPCQLYQNSGMLYNVLKEEVSCKFSCVHGA
jgi:hypothetical protein